MEESPDLRAKKEEPIGRVAGRLAVALLVFGNAVLWPLHRITWFEALREGPLGFLALLGNFALFAGAVSALVWLFTPTGRKGRRRPAWLATGLLIGAGFLMCLGLCGTGIKIGGIPPSSKTLMTMHILERHVLRYANRHNALPANLSALPPPAEHVLTETPLSDYWGRPILCQVNADGSVTLTSYGKDGRPGGFGDAQDVVHRFQTRWPDGSWRRENEYRESPTTQSTQPALRE